MILLERDSIMFRSTFRKIQNTTS